MSGTRKHLPRCLAVGALLLGLAGLLLGCGSDGAEPAEVDTAELERLADEAPPRLARIYAQGNELLTTGPDGFEETMGSLRGFPVVVNVWASWCGPCRAEFPHLREAALELGDEVAFLGIDSDDNEDAARTFLRDHPVPYPSFADPDEELTIGIGATFGLPATAFYGPGGEQAHIRHGGYTSTEELITDIERHALSQ